MKNALEDFVAQELDSVGYDLIELRRGGTRNRPLIEVRIDRRDGAAVTIDDCAVASRALEARLDGSGTPRRSRVAGLVAGRAPVADQRHWRRFVGEWAKRAEPGARWSCRRKIATVKGQVGRRAGTRVLELVNGVVRRIPLAAIKEAWLAFHL